MSGDARVVITGLGPICSLGVGREQVWNNLRAGKTNLQSFTQVLHGEDCFTYPLQIVPEADMASVTLPEKACQVVRQKRDGDSDIDLRFALGAIHLALEDSGLTYNPETNNVGLVFTHENPGVDKVLEKIFAIAGDLVFNPSKLARLAGMSKVSETLVKQVGQSVYEMQTFIYLYLVAKAFNLHGYSLYVNNACASGLFAIESAARQIRAGGSSAMVVVGGDHPTFFTKYLWFKQMGLYARKMGRCARLTSTELESCWAMAPRR